jgi:hypothetical protein
MNFSLKKISVVLLLLYSYLVTAQVFSSDTIPFGEDLSNYNWDKNTGLSVLSPDELKEDAVIVKELKILDYELTTTNLMLNYTVHKRVRVTKEKAIAEFSRVYIPVNNIEGNVQLSVRTIQANGKVLNLDNSKIKELKNVEEAGDFKIFAFEGVEPGCEVEYILKYTKPASTVGREILQSEYNRSNCMVFVRIPTRFVFDPVFYNCNYKFTKKEKEYSNGSFNTFFTGSLKIEKLKEEEMAYYTSALARIDYSIRARSQFYSSLTWQSMSKQVIEKLYPEYNKKVEKQCKTLQIFKKANDTEKIQAIEAYIKNNIAVVNNVEKEETVSSILKNKFATETGLLMLYMTFFKHAEISYNLVFTTDRTRTNFDKETPSWFFLEQNLFFFPKLQTYLAPTSVYLRYPMFPTNWANNDGLFITVIHDKNTPKAKTSFDYDLKRIEGLSYENNGSLLDVSVNFDLDKEVAVLNLQESFTGEPASYYQPFYGLIEESKQKEIINSILKKPSEEGTPSEGVVLNYNRDISPTINPFIVKGKLSSSQLLQSAGKKYIFNLGDVIGPQSEWYKDTLKRVLPIQPRYGHFYIRNIEINIPEGYQVKNLESINMDVTMAFEKDPKSCYFKSWYKQEGNKIKVTIEEYYKLAEYPAEKYEEFRQVINAAADFNKVTVLLEEK